jgi:hypothetical protein
MTNSIEIKTNLEKATLEEKIEKIEELYNKWIVKPVNKYTLYECLQHSVECLGLDINNFQIGLFEKAINNEYTYISYLKLYTVVINDEIKDEFHRKSIENKLNVIMKSVVSSDNAIRYNFKLQKAILEDDIGSSIAEDLFDFVPMDMSDTSQYQNLLLYLLENLARKGYRRYKGSCYEKIYTPSGNDTHCWKLSKTLKHFIYESTRKDVCPEMWKNLTHSKANDDNAVKYLENHIGAEFEDIKKDRHVFSFNDGIYITMKKENGKYIDEWIPYGTKKIGSDVVSSNYFNLDFDSSTRPVREPNQDVLYYSDYEITEEEENALKEDNDPEWLEDQHKKEQEYRYNNWWHIIVDKCPHFKGIMEYQEWDNKVQKFLCVLIGRCLYDVNELDGWQIVAFLLGQAGSGKSTILDKILKKFYESCDVGVLSNNMETKFGLQAFYDKLLFIAPEVKENFKLEQAEFQSMISGESMLINKKFEIGESVERWLVPGMFAGNVVPQWNDNSGSISRRMLTFLFNLRVKKGDSQLGIKLEKEIGYILQACNRAYLDAVNTYGSEDIWSIVPKYFRDTRDEMAETTNALTNFLGSDKVMLGPDQSVKETTFVDAFNDHCRELNYPKQRWNAQYCLGPFSVFNIIIDKHNRSHGVTSTFFKGVNVKTIIKAPDGTIEGFKEDD